MRERVAVLRRWWGWPPVGLFLGTRVATAVVVVLFHSAHPGADVVASITIWDAAWNNLVANQGYQDLTLGPAVFDPQQPLAFFPVLPMAARGLHVVTGLSTGTAGMVVAVACALAGTVVLWRLVADRFDDEVASDSVLLLLVSPFAFVFSLFYTEGPALLAVALCFLALDRRRWAWAGVAALVAGAVRPNGFLLVVPCLVAAVLAIHDRKEWRSLWAPALAPLGFLAWVGYVAHRTGELGGYFRLQNAGWSARIDGGRETARAVLDMVRFRWDEADRLFNAAALVLIGGVGLVLAVRRRLDPVWIAYAAAVVVLTALNARQASAGRFLVLAFPLFVAFALSTPKRAIPLLAATSAVVMGAVFYAALLQQVTP